MIDNNIAITVLDVDGDTITLGIVAPKQVGIHRKEVYELIQKANIEANAVNALPEEVKTLLKKNIEKL